jgi:hypothetical protein
MIVTKFLPGGGWYAEVMLDDSEWPPIDQNDQWLDRPIRRWVVEHAIGEHFFSAVAGTILFNTKSDLMMFQLVWG